MQFWSFYFIIRLEFRKKLSNLNPYPNIFNSNNFFVVGASKQAIEPANEMKSLPFDKHHTSSFM